ncbi:MAG: O-antigen ligase family protein [Gemmatimonadales bacterium]
MTSRAAMLRAVEEIRSSFPPFALVVLAAAFAGMVWPAPIDFGYQPAARALILYAVIGSTALAVALSLAGRDMLWVALLGPFVIQYYQVALGWEVTLGSTSPLRVAPVLGVLALLAVELTKRPVRLSRAEAAVTVLWELACLIWLVEGLAATGTAVPLVTWLLNAGVPPLCYFLVRDRLAAPDRAAAVGLSVLGGFLILIVASIGISFVALDYRGSASLLAARNANDGNIVLGYLMLAWPIAVLTARAIHGALVPALGLSFVAGAVLLFSRGGLLVVPLLTIGTLVVLAGRPLKTLVSLLVIGAAALGLWVALGDSLGLMEAWTARLNFTQLQLTDLWAVLATLQDQLTSSGRSEIWDLARSLFRSSPLTGAGFNSFEAAGPGYSEAHSLFYQTLGQRGLLGVVFLYGFLGWWLWTLLRPVAAAGEVRERLVRLGGVLSWLVFTHAVGSGLVVTTGGGLMVNVAGAMLLMIALQPMGASRSGTA